MVDMVYVHPYVCHMETNDTTELFEVYFTLGTDTFGRRLETRVIRRASSVEEAVEMVVRGGVAREAITGAGIA